MEAAKVWGGRGVGKGATGKSGGVTGEEEAPRVAMVAEMEAVEGGIWDSR